MTLLEKLQAHKGDLVCIKSELYWYERRSRDGSPGRICLLLDAETVALYDAKTAAIDFGVISQAAALLLIDGAPHWVWAAAEDIELLDGDHR